MKVTLSRRNFIKGTAALGMAATVGGHSAAEAVEIPVTSQSGEQVYYSGCVHNCGAGVRCLLRMHVKDGKIHHISSDDSDLAFDGSIRNKEQYNDSRALACPKGRAYKYRAHHPGRLQYALKQTKQRGDMTGFVKISTEQAMKEIAMKYRAVYSKYGAGAIFNADCSAAKYGGTFSDPANARDSLSAFIGGTRGFYSDYSYHQYNYAWSLTGHPGVRAPYEKQNNIGHQFGHIAGVVKNIVSWGTNALTTNNTVAYPYIRVVEMMKKRNPNGKVIFIGPEFVDTGVTLATDWLQLRNYTDVALVMAMFHEMLINTFDKDGNILPNPWLDVDYIDTMVYGFFDSPAYWVNTKNGEISYDAQVGADWRKIDEVPAGQSLSAYVMGADNRLQKAQYSVAGSYNGAKFAEKMKYRNMSGCSYTVSGKPAYKLSSGQLKNSKYQYKQDFMTPKTPEWAEQICGTPAQSIRDLAQMYCDPKQHPIFNEWCGGLQKQENGVVNLFAIATLLCVTKTFGMNGEGLYGPWASVIKNQGDAGNPADYLSPEGSVPKGRPAYYAEKRTVPSISCKEWFNAIKVGYFETLKENGYTGKHIPNWDQKDRFANDDGGAKTGLKWLYDENGKKLTFKDPNTGLEYYDYEGRKEGKPVFVGTRMIVVGGGGRQVNQSSNTNDTTEMYKCLPVSGDVSAPDFADTFCLVTFDIFMSPTARYADYVLPSTVSLEAGDWMAIAGETYYRPGMVKPLGEAKDGWRLAYEGYKAQSELGSFNGVDTKDAHLKYVGTADTTRKYQSGEELSDKIVEKAINDPASRFYKMTRAEVYASQYRPRKNQPMLVTKELIDDETQGGALRRSLDKYLALPVETRRQTPFIFASAENVAEANVANWGNGAENIAEDLSARPQFAGRFQAFNNTAVWDYEHRFTKYHGWLPQERRGQNNADREGDAKVYPIPMYFNFQDCFNEMYGVFDGKIENDLSKKGGLTLSTTHDRYRVHSTHNENPYMRELNHRTKGGGWASGNDWKEYAVMPANPEKTLPMISGAVFSRNPETASWHEIWINDQDAAERGIQDGDLVRVENPIGAVRVIARVTSRCVRGHVNLHQGGWYDPNPVDGVDDGGCANTVMSSAPSRYDNGNAQQMAYVTIRKED